jgi:hypothetical protein
MNINSTVPNNYLKAAELQNERIIVTIVVMKEGRE